MSNCGYKSSGIGPLPQSILVPFTASTFNTTTNLLLEMALVQITHSGRTTWVLHCPY